MLKKLISLLLVMGMLAGSFGVLAEETEISGDIDLAIEEVETEGAVYSDIPEIDEEEEDIPIIEEISEDRQSMLEDSEPAGETTTEPVDDSTTLADGEYTPDGFDFTGGTGKVKIVCDKVIVANGKASAVIKFSSNRYNLVKASGQAFTTEDYADSEYTIPIDLNVENRILATTYAMTEPHEVEYMITVQLAEPETAETTTEPVDDSTTLADGEYVPDDFSFTGGTGKVKITCDKVIVDGGKASAVIKFSSNRYNLVKASGQKFTTEDYADSEYTIPIDLNVENRILATTYAMTEPHEIEYTIIVTLDETAPEEQLEDGDYRITVDTGTAMFKVTDCTLFAKDGKYTAILTLSGTGYDYLFAGTAEEADKADPSEYIPFVENAEGKYTYTFPVSALGTAIPAASHSLKNQMWYDRTLTFLTSTAEVIDHIPGEAVIENFQDSTYTEEGSCEEVIYCIGCGAEISREVKTIPAKEYPSYDMAMSKNKQQIVNIGEKLQLTINCAEEKGFAVKSWKSSNAKVASVQDGLVTGIKEGTATITANLTNKKTAKVTVKIVDPKKPVKVALDSVGTHIFTMTEKYADNETIQLSPVLTPATAEAVFTWKSSNKKAAIVDQNGVVMPVGSGSAVITVTAKYKKTVKTASVKVKVTDLHKPAKVSLDVEGTQYIEMGRNFADNTIQLTPTVFDADGTEGVDTSITWKSSSTKVAIVSESGRVIPMGAGSATITVTAKRSGVTKTASVKIIVTDPFKPTGAALNVQGTQILKAGETLQLSAVSVPDAETEVILTWKSSDKKIAKVDQTGLVTGVKAGTATITVTAKRGTVSKTTSVKVKVAK